MSRSFAFGLTERPQRHGRKSIAWRPNVLSDIPWHAEPWVQSLPKRLRRYGYTKRTVTPEKRSGVDLTYRISERQPTLAGALEILANPPTHRSRDRGRPAKSIAGYPVHDGERTDERWTEPSRNRATRSKG